MKILMLIILLSSNVFAFGNDFKWWNKLKQIKPLQTNKQQVESLLGISTEKGTRLTYYEISEHHVSVEYADGYCNEFEKGEWDAPNGTVIRYDFKIFAGGDYPALKDFAKFAKINLNGFSIKKYKNVNEVDTPSMIPYNYDNKKLGIFLEGFKRGYENEDGSLRVGKVIYLRGISVYPPENSKYPKCN
jgi:hypothetical protein